MKLTFINIYPKDTAAAYLLSAYVLKAYADQSFGKDSRISIHIRNFPEGVNEYEVCEEVLNEKPDCVAYSCYIWNIETIKKIARLLKRTPGLVHIYGGPEISLDTIPELGDLSEKDFYVIGEGEKKLVDILAHLESRLFGVETAIPKGVARFQNGAIHHEKNENVVPLGEIPSIYLTGTMEPRLYERKQAFLETQRGCKYRCKYCVYHKHMKGKDYYPLERIFRELDHLIIEKRIYALRIFDALFTSDLERAKKIAKHIIQIRKQYRVLLSWVYWEFNYDDADEEFIQLAGQLRSRDGILNTRDVPARDRPQLYSEILKGYTAINCVGIQSFCAEALRAVARPRIDLGAFQNFMTIARRHNIVLKLDVILGLPHETMETFFDGLEFFLPFFEDTDHILNIHRLQILPGSRLADEYTKFGIRYSRTAPHVVFSTDSFAEVEMDRAARLCALLFRIVNSPLRRDFFDCAGRKGLPFYELLQEIYDRIAQSRAFGDAKLLRSERVDDVYWNDDIFRELPSLWLRETLQSI